MLRFWENAHNEKKLFNWRWMGIRKKLAIDNYPELEWERGDHGKYENFDFILKNQRRGRG